MKNNSLDISYEVMPLMDRMIKDLHYAGDESAEQGASGSFSSSFTKNITSRLNTLLQSTKRDGLPGDNDKK